MEARGKFDFVATAEDELSFHKGDVLKIVSYQDDWLKAEMHGREGFVPKNYVDTQLPGWFQENASRSSAEETLMSQEVGSFLIRGSQSSPGDFSISVRHECDVQHFKVMKDSKAQFYLWSEKFTSLNKLVDFYKTTSISKQREILLRVGSQEEAAVPSPHLSKQSSLEDRSQSEGSAGKSSVAAARRSSDNTPTPRVSVQVKALYDFMAEEDDELGFSTGDVIEVLDGSDSSWWKGRLHGNVGLFPANYTAPM